MSRWASATKSTVAVLAPDKAHINSRSLVIDHHLLVHPSVVALAETTGQAMIHISLVSYTHGIPQASHRLARDVNLGKLALRNSG
jgi:hypothetical protein